ncbi:hypothetical protein D3C71_2218590 [compost metagenome]
MVVSRPVFAVTSGQELAAVLDAVAAGLASLFLSSLAQPARAVRSRLAVSRVDNAVPFV